MRSIADVPLLEGATIHRKLGIQARVRLLESIVRQSLHSVPVILHLNYVVPLLFAELKRSDSVVHLFHFVLENLP